MTPREITAQEVKVGDRVLWTDGDTLVEGAVRAANSTYQWIIIARAGWSLDNGQTLTLLDRPLPPIPVAEGTVVRSKSSGAVYVRCDGRWLSAGGSHSGLPYSDTREHYDVLVPEQVDQ